jgi:hypothetical protein
LPLAVPAQPFQAVAGEHRENPQIVGRPAVRDRASEEPSARWRGTSGWAGDERAAPSRRTGRT